MARFHYELYRPAAMQPDWSTSLSCGLIIIIVLYIYRQENSVNNNSSLSM